MSKGLIKEKEVDNWAWTFSVLKSYTLFHTLYIYSKNSQLKCDEQWSLIFPKAELTENEVTIS